MPSYPLSRVEFEQKRAAGDFDPQATYDDYLAMIREREEMLLETQEAARRDGYELGAPQLDLSPADEAALERAWAKMAEEKQSLPAARGA